MRGIPGFAAGGIVAVPGASTSGVADDIHVDDAPVGSFVLPADSVQALRRSNPELLAQILAVIQQAGGDADGAATAQIAISNGELFIPPEAVAALGGAEVLAAIKDATHQQVNAPSAKPIDAPPPPGGVNAPLDAVVQPPRGLPLDAFAASGAPGTPAADAQRTYFADGGDVDEEDVLRKQAEAQAAATQAQMDEENEARVSQEIRQDAERQAAQQAAWQEQAAANDAQRRQLFGVPAGLPLW